jgi:hypothetical protein
LYLQHWGGGGGAGTEKSFALIIIDASMSLEQGAKRQILLANSWQRHLKSSYISQDDAK